GGKFRKPALLLLLGAVMQNVGRDDTGMQRRAERVESRERQLAIDHSFMSETAAGTAIFFGHGGAQQPGLACLGPYIAVVYAGFVPTIELRNEFVVNEASCLFFKKHEIFGHPLRARQIEGIHRLDSPHAHNKAAPWSARGGRKRRLDATFWPDPSRSRSCRSRRSGPCRRPFRPSGYRHSARCRGSPDRSK